MPIKNGCNGLTTFPIILWCYQLLWLLGKFLRLPFDCCTTFLMSLSSCSSCMLCLKVKLSLLITKHHVLKQYEEVQCSSRSVSMFMSPQGGPVIPPGSWFPFRHLLRFAGLRWRYSEPPQELEVQFHAFTPLTLAYIEVSGRLHDPVTLTQRKNPRFPSERKPPRAL
jgi:hypothetical protein